MKPEVVALTAELTREEVARRGRAIYEQRLRERLLAAHKGEFVVVDVLTGDYEVDSDDVTAEMRLRARRPEAALYETRVGYTTAYSLGGGMVEDERR
jgi:hypothetical protein